MKTVTGFLFRKPKGHPVFNRAESPQGDRDTLLVIPTDIVVNYPNELLDGDALPVPRMEQFVLQPTE